MNRKRILIIDDEKRQRNIMKEVLAASYLLMEAENLHQALELAQQTPPDLILLDVMLGDSDSVNAIQNGELSFQAPIILVTGRRGEALRERIVGAGNIRDFLYKPYDEDELLAIVQKHLGPRPQPVDVRAELKRNYDEKHTAASAIVCACNAMVDAKRRIRAFAQSDVMVLIRGETGAGKELVAQEIHRQSPRHEKPFVAVNCTAIPDTLLESELFGYAPHSGIYNANPRGKPGMFELANGGTVFLDEIGDMPLLTQTKILRVLQDKQVMRLSGTTPTSVDVRIITATHQDVEAAVGAGRFRADLYYRIKVAEIKLPPLCQRGDDVKLLIEHFLRKAETALKKSIGISHQALELLLAYPWPGNVRELEHALTSAVALTPIYGDLITEEHLDEHIREYRQIALTSDHNIWTAIAETLERFDRVRLTIEDIEAYTNHFRCLLLDGVLKANDGVQTKATRQLGVGEKFYSQKTGAYQQWLQDIRSKAPKRRENRNEQMSK